VRHTERWADGRTDRNGVTALHISYAKKRNHSSLSDDHSYGTIIIGQYWLITAHITGNDVTTGALRCAKLQSDQHHQHTTNTQSNEESA